MALVDNNIELDQFSPRNRQPYEESQDPVQEHIYLSIIIQNTWELCLLAPPCHDRDFIATLLPLPYQGPNDPVRPLIRSQIQREDNADPQFDRIAILGISLTR